MNVKKVMGIIVVVFLLVGVLSACSMLSGLTNTGNTNEENKKSDSNVINVSIYNVEGSTFSAADFIDTTKGVIKIPEKTPTRTGYDFNGWYYDEACKNKLKAGDSVKDKTVINIYAKWSVSQFDVKFVDANNVNGDKVVRYNYGETISVRDPECEGYTFVGWYKNEARTEIYDVTKPITSEFTLYAKWQYVTYTITYEKNGGQFSEEAVIPETYDLGSVITLPLPSKEGYDFMGWYDNQAFSGVAITGFSQQTGNKTFYAKYLSLNADMAAKTGLSTSTGGKTFELYTDSTAHDLDLKTFFDFSENSSVTATDEEEVVYANGIVSLTANAGTSGVKDHVFTVTVISESGLTTETYEVTIKQYDENTVTIRYEVDGSLVFSAPIGQGAVLTEGNAYHWTGTKVGYEFAFWSENGTDEYAFGTSITENLVLTAVFEAIEYNVTYYLGKASNNVNNPTTYTFESNVALLNATPPTGYIFVGWYSDGTYETEVTTLGGRTGDIVLYALYTKAKKWNFVESGGEYTVTMAQYPYFLDYVMYNRMTTAVVNVTDKPNDFVTNYQNPDFTGATYTNEQVQEQHIKTYAKATTPAGEVPVSYGLSLTASGNKVTLTFTYNTNFAPHLVSAEGLYDQINFIELVERTGRANDFNDFAVNHIQETLPASDTEQLFFALENGYRPVCEDESIAQDVYDEMLVILRQNVNDAMSDREKILAIGEYLVRTVQYDNYVYNLFVHGGNTSDCRCFGLEGAILDGVAVCDGISKAFACLCRIEGIEAFQVTGQKGEDQEHLVNHAWNKVFVDLNGDGTKEWTVVDCTAANLLLSEKEVMNYTFIFTTDDYLERQNYIYNEEYEGLYETTFEYNIYTEMTVGEDVGFYISESHSAQDLNAVFTYYAAVKNAQEEEDLPISFAISGKENLFFNTIGEEKQYTIAMQSAITNAGLQIAKFRFTTLQSIEDEEVVILFYFEK